MKHSEIKVTYAASACRTRSAYTATTRPRAMIVAVMFRNTRKYVREPNPFRHLGCNSVDILDFWCKHEISSGITSVLRHVFSHISELQIMPESKICDRLWDEKNVYELHPCHFV